MLWKELDRPPPRPPPLDTNKPESQRRGEVSALVSPDVASTLDPSRSYGVWWYGRERHTHTQRRDVAPDGTPSYKRAKKSVPADRKDWVAVPVPDAGIPRQWVLAARETIKDNIWTSSAGDRVWELTGGVLRCAECGRAMSVNYIRAKGRGYYRCTGRYNGGLKSPCTMSRTMRAELIGARVWDFVSEILTNPSNLARGLERLIENERAVRGGRRGFMAQKDRRDRPQAGTPA